MPFLASAIIVSTARMTGLDSSGRCRRRSTQRQDLQRRRRDRSRVMVAWPASCLRDRPTAAALPPPVSRPDPCSSPISPSTASPARGPRIHGVRRPPVPGDPGRPPAPTGFRRAQARLADLYAWWRAPLPLPDTPPRLSRTVPRTRHSPAYLRPGCCGDLAVLAAEETVWPHGGIGMT